MPRASGWEQRLRQARDAWPSIEIDASAFQEVVEARSRPLAGVCVEDLYLAFACTGGDRAALDAFEATFVARVPHYLGLRPTDPFVDEVCQAMRVHLLTPPGWRIRDYAGQGSLDGWLRVVVVRLAGRLRRGRRGPEQGAELATPARHPELDYLARRHQADFAWALGEGLRALSTEDRQLARLYFAEHLTVVELGAKMGASGPTASRRLAAIRREVLATTLSRLRERLQLTDAELVSLLRLVRDDLHLSLERLFASGRASSRPSGS